jgi:hypothetical protein
MKTYRVVVRCEYFETHEIEAKDELDIEDKFYYRKTELIETEDNGWEIMEIKEIT